MIGRSLPVEAQGETFGDLEVSPLPGYSNTPRGEFLSMLPNIDVDPWEDPAQPLNIFGLEIFADVLYD